MRFYLWLLLFNLFSFSAWAETLIEFPEENEAISLIIRDGLPYVNMSLKFSNGKKLTGQFMVDTGTSGSIIDKQFVEKELGKKIPEEDMSLETDEPDYPRFISITKAFTGNLKINDWSLLIMDLNGLMINAKKGTGTCIGIIGTDILYKKSLFLSLTSKKMSFVSTLPFEETAYIEASPFFWNNELILLRVPVDTRYCGSGMAGLGKLSPGQKEPGYFIDTGCFGIVTGSLDDFENQLKYMSSKVFLSEEISYTGDLFKTGYTILPDFKFESQSFQNVLFSRSGIPSFYKSLGTQILARFDIWIEAHSLGYNPRTDGLTSEIYLRPVEVKEYQAFLDAVDYNDNRIYLKTRGYNLDKKGVVTRVFYDSTWTPLLEGVALGDRAISYDGRRYRQRNEARAENPLVVFERSDGSRYSVHAPWHYLQDEATGEGRYITERLGPSL